MVKLECLITKQKAARRLQRLQNPSGPMHVAQAARRFFNVRLELENGVAKLFVANGFQVNQALQEAVAVLSSQFREDLAFEFFGSLWISKQESRIEKGGIGFHVPFIKLCKILDVPNLVAHLELKVP